MKTIKPLIVAMGLIVLAMSLRLQTHTQGTGHNTPEQESLSASQGEIGDDKDSEGFSL